MTRPWFLILLAPMLGACVSVASVGTAVTAGDEVFEPRLVGTWELSEDTSVSSRFVITQEGAAQYLVRDYEVQGSTTVLAGRLGPLGSRRWIFELSPVGDTSKYFHPLSGSDSTRLNPPSYPLMLPIHMPLVIERADSGWVFSAFNGDSLLADLKSGRLRTPYSVVKQGDLNSTVLLTEQEPRNLNAALQTFADGPGRLIRLARVGQRLTLRIMH